MAITVNATIPRSANTQWIPSSYSPTALPSIGVVEVSQEINFNVTASLVENAVVATALANLETQVESYVSGTFMPSAAGADALKTIDVNVTVKRVARGRDVEDIFLNGGTEVYFVTALVEWRTT